MKLDLASGPHCPAGFEGVDLVPYPGVVHIQDLLDFPWPWADSSVSELRVSHFLETIPEAYWTPDGTASRFMVGAQDLLCKFWDECWRVLEPGGLLHVIAAQAHSDRAYADPLFRRRFVQGSFLYLDKAIRESMALGPLSGYCVDADFPFDADTIMLTPSARLASQLARLDPAARAMLHWEKWNVMEDIDATLVAKKAPSKAPPETGLSAEDLAKPHLFRVTGQPGGFTVRPGNMALPGDRPQAVEVRRFSDE